MDTKSIMLEKEEVEMFCNMTRNTLCDLTPNHRDWEKLEKLKNNLESELLWWNSSK